MEVLKLLNIKSPVLLLKPLYNGQLAIIDAHNTLRIIDPKDYKVTGGFKSNIVHTRFVGTHVDVTPDGKYSISIIPGVNKAAIFSVDKKELLYQVGRHQGEIESVAIDPNSRYCITCGQDGKAFAWVLKTAHLAFSLPHHADFITTVAFNESGQWVATGSYDRTINLLNIATLKHSTKLLGHNSVIVKIIFLPEARLLSADRDGTLIIWDMHKGKIIKRLSKMNDAITALSISDDKRFVFVGTKLGYVGLYDLESMELLKHSYLKENEEITSIAFIVDHFRLAVGTATGNVRIYPLFGVQDEYIKMIRERRYREFYEALEDNPMLLYSKPYEVAERIWSDTLTQARAFLEARDSDKVKELFDPFTGVPKKNALITQMRRDYEKFEQFLTCTQEGKLPLAYSLAKQYPSFQLSEAYTAMEHRWKHLFSKAQELILASNGDEQARNLLAPYRGISEKTVLIQELFQERRMYDYFKKVVAQQDYVKFFSLVKMYPFLKEFPEYSTVMEYADRLYIQTQKGYTSGDYATAKKGCEVLVSFPDYAQDAQKILDAIKVKYLFYDAISSDNLNNAFSYLTLYPVLYETPQAQALERKWNEVVDQAQRYAAKGLIKEMLNVFEPYRTIKDKFPAMGAVFAQCYSTQLEEKLRNHASQRVIENGIRQYVAFFGKDDMILQIYDHLKSNYTPQINLETLKQGSLAAWIPSMVIADITVGG